jgi:hypothetical protein
MIGTSETGSAEEHACAHNIGACKRFHGRLRRERLVSIAVSGMQEPIFSVPLYIGDGDAEEVDQDIIDAARWAASRGDAR